MKRLPLLFALVLPLFFAGTSPNGYQVGDQVEDFNLKSTAGTMVSLSDYADQNGVILIFDCNTCPVSKLYNDRIKDLQEKYAGKGFPVVAINANDPEQSPGDSFEKMKEYAAKKQYEHVYLQDIGQSVARAFGATNTPHVFVLKNENGNFIVSYIGAIDNNARNGDEADKKYVEKAVNALLRGESPEIPSTKAIGCTIKWKNA